MSNLYPTNQMNLINYDTGRFYSITSETVSDVNLISNKSVSQKIVFVSCYWLLKMLFYKWFPAFVQDFKVIPHETFLSDTLFVTIDQTRQTNTRLWLTKKPGSEELVDNVYFLFCVKIMV